MEEVYNETFSYIRGEQSFIPVPTIAEIKKKYSTLAKNIIELIEKLDDIRANEKFTESDKKYIQKRDCDFVLFNLKSQGVALDGMDLSQNILEATLFDAVKKAVFNYGNPEKGDWIQWLHNSKTEFLKFDEDTTELLIAVSRLFTSLRSILFSFADTARVKLINYCNEEKSITDFLDLFDFRNLYYRLENEPDLILKSNQYHNAIADKDLLCINNDKDPETFNLNKIFKKKCLQAIKIIDNQIKNTLRDNTNLAVENNDALIPDSQDNIKNTEFTTRRQVLAMYYILNELDKNTNNIDRSVKTRFIQFLTSKNESNIYKILSDPLKGLDEDKSSKSILRDLEYIKIHFDKLNLHEISKKISKDMS